MRFQRSFAFGFLFVALLFTEGCSVSIKGLRTDPAFTYAALHEGRMAVGGVISSSGKVSRRDQTRYERIVAREMAEKRPGLKVSGSADLRRRLGKAKYTKLLAEYEELGGLSHKHIGVLSKKIKRTDYLVFAVIEGDRTEYDRSETSSSYEHGVYTPGGVTTTATRTVEVEIRVYDLALQRNVWIGTIKKRTTNSRRFIRENSLVALAKAVTNNRAKTYSFPKAPSLAKALAGVFSAFADHMPKHPRA
jgi:hypothetical protein